MNFKDVDVVQVRIARPTNQLDKVVAFYRDGLGLSELYRFQDHDGYDGVMLGLPGKPYHLELTQRAGDAPHRAPGADNLLVLYIPDPAGLARLRGQLAQHGHKPVEPENPYWLDKSVTFEDPDGYRVVLCSTPGI